MIQSTTGFIHTLAAVCALVAGVIVFSRPKATKFHRAVGYFYSVSMTVMLVTSFCIYHLTRSFNFLHIFSIASCPPLILGLAAAIRRRSGWLPRHYYWMCYSYLGLCAAFIAETATRIVMPYLVTHHQLRSMAWFWGIVGVCTAAVFFAGTWLMARNTTLLAKLQPSKAA